MKLQSGTGAKFLLRVFQHIAFEYPGGRLAKVQRSNAFPALKFMQTKHGAFDVFSGFHAVEIHVAAVEAEAGLGQVVRQFVHRIGHQLIGKLFRNLENIAVGIVSCG